VVVVVTVPRLSVFAKIVRNTGGHVVGAATTGACVLGCGTGMGMPSTTLLLLYESVGMGCLVAPAADGCVGVPVGDGGAPWLDGCEVDEHPARTARTMSATKIRLILRVFVAVVLVASTFGQRSSSGKLHLCL
jgi:hypothetical protein